MPEDIHYFEFDNCYSALSENQNFSNDTQFKNFLESSFNIYDIDKARECESLAIMKKSQFYLLSDLCNNTLTTNCYIPRIESSNKFSDNIDTLIKPFNDLLDKLFGSETNRFANSVGVEISNNFDIVNNEKCLKYTIDNMIYAPKNIFALYKSATLNPAISNLMVQNYDYYQNKFNNLPEYEQFLKLPLDNNAGGTLGEAFKEYICSPTKNTEANYDYYIAQLKEKYSVYFNELDNISKDLSNLAILTKQDNIFLQNIEKLIKDKNMQLVSLLGTGGANNGRLEDTNYLKNVKITEVSILILVILITVFIYNKNK
jgi:hypothetical protein